MSPARSVKAALPPETKGCKVSLDTKRRAKDTAVWDTAERTRWQRNAQAMVNSAAGGDPEAFAALVELADWLSTEGLREAAAGLQDNGYSWADIARPLGVSRQGAYLRFRARP